MKGACVAGAGFSRRWFIGGLTSFGAFGGARMLCAAPGVFSGRKPRLSFGVMSDVHLRVGPDGTGLQKGYGTDTLDTAFAWFRDQGADAVMIAGDMADKGCVAELEALAAAWYRAFPDDAAPDGRRVERLFVYGNHDWEGFKYGDYMKKIYPDGNELAKHILRTDMKGSWERIFHEPYSPVYRKDVRGYTFIGAHWTSDCCRGADERGVAGVEEFFSANARAIDPSRPFFYFQHPHPRNTCYGPWAWGRDNGGATRALSAHPGAIAFSGHSHYSLTDERSIWQGDFTSVGTSSMRYTSMPYQSRPPRGYENAAAPAAREYDPYKVMGRLGTSDGRQGMLVKVFDDCVTFTRREFVYGGSLGDDWVLPLPSAEPRPFDFARRAAASRAPQFPAGAKVSVRKVVARNRGGKAAGGATVEAVEKDAWEVRFPAANAVAGARPLEYEVTAEPKTGEKAVRHVVAQGFNMPVGDGRAQGESFCVIAADSLPQGVDIRFSVRPLNSLGKAGGEIRGEWISATVKQS